MIITATLARLLYRRHISGGHFPAHLSWRVYTHLETIPDGAAVFTFVTDDTLCALIGTRERQAKQEAKAAA